MPTDTSNRPCSRARRMGIKGSDVFRLIAASCTPLGNKARRRSQCVGFCAEGGQRRIGFLDEFLEARASAIHAKNRNERSLAGSGIFSSGFAQGLRVSL